jgi:adenosine deaminase
MSIASYLLAVPKAELHVHLEGSIQPSTLLLLAKQNGVTLPADTVEGVKSWFVYRDFPHFIDVFVTVTRCLKRAEDYELVVHDYGAAMARQNIRYAEVTFSPSTHGALGVSQQAYMDGLTRGRQRVLAEFGVEINWVFDVVRVRDSPRRERLADYTTRVAIEGLDSHVVALGLGGLEDGAPPEPYAPWFDRARAAGLRSTPHAGETAGPPSIWGALRALGAERIGHGVRAIEDPALVEHLADRRILLEISPTSNICLGIYDSLSRHPLRRLYEAGIPLTVNSDDPPLFNTTLSDELGTLVGPFHLDIAAIDEIVLNGARYCFLPVERKQALEEAFQAEMDALKVEHGLPSPPDPNAVHRGAGLQERG